MGEDNNIFEDRIDEYAISAFGAMGFKGRLPDTMVELYQQVKRKSDMLRPGRLDPQIFALIAVFSSMTVNLDEEEVGDDDAKEEPLRIESQDSNDLQSIGIIESVRINFMGDVYNAHVIEYQDDMVVVTIEGDDAEQRTLPKTAIVKDVE